MALPVLAKRINESAARRTFAVEGMIALSRSGDNCRCSALEILGELIYLFHEDPLGPPQELLDIYWDDSNDRHVFANDCVWDIIAAYNVSPAALSREDLAEVTISSPASASLWDLTGGLSCAGCSTACRNGAAKKS